MHASFFAFSTIFLTASVVANPITTSQSLDSESPHWHYWSFEYSAHAFDIIAPRATLVYVNSAQVPIPLPESSTTVVCAGHPIKPLRSLSS